MINKHYFTCMDCGTQFVIIARNERYSELLGSCAEALPSCPECESYNTNMDDVTEERPLVVDVLELFDKYSKLYAKDAVKSIRRNQHMHNVYGCNNVDVIVDKNVVDATIVDFINFIAGEAFGVDYAMHTKDLYESGDVSDFKN